MNTPFPGMDPYLEHPSLWPDVHNRLITALADAISPTIAPNYYVGVESRAYVMAPEGDEFLGRPDLAIASPIPINPQPSYAQPVAVADLSVLEVEFPYGEEINHYYLEIRTAPNHELVTVVELLSPVNKIDPRGRRDYEDKRAEIISSQTSLVEIDLLRAGQPLPLSKQVLSDYRLVINRGWKGRRGQLYAFNLANPIPAFPLPLLPQDTEPLIPLNEVLHALYGRARFDLRIDYRQPPIPPLTPAQAEWASQLLAA
ncbi:MAG: DUF4058 family protein [Chloroflexi bacterium]|nr:DUF4058 family protein [Chloroflexota bacterium]